MKQQTYRVQINGIVQGVGFRPFVYGLANRFKINGWVRNTSGGVSIEVSGPENILDQFISSLENETPPLAQIDSFRVEKIEFNHFDSFQILHSQPIAGGFQPISPDVSICTDCLSELFNPSDRRYRYPFTNCTNCGPRFTIIKDIPYDRPKTTMAGFSLCPSCQSEYENPLDRRFHAQPIACPACGPQVWLEYPEEDSVKSNSVENDAILKTQELLAAGKIVAIKGLGGFHLACDGGNSRAVQRLRDRKDRPAKPMAVMMPDLDTVREHCQVSARESALLISVQRPILLLDKKSGSSLAEELAPGQNTLGVMLPYTPLHYLLFSQEDQYPGSRYSVLVMTSANFSGNPILTENQEVRDSLKNIADAYLFHDRDIYVHCDDTVSRIPKQLSEEIAGSYQIRRSRGYSPHPIKLPGKSGSILGVGGELKNTFCLIKEDYAFLSQHIGDLKNFETLTSFEKSITHFENLFRIIPELITYDLHPDYLSTRYALDRSKSNGIPAIPIQHHHAHIASCLADNMYREDDPVIGIAFDGIGYGEDGLLWGGEFLIADYQRFTRAGQLQYYPLPGGDNAIREPWRMALSVLHSCGLPWDEENPAVKYALGLADQIRDVSPFDVLSNQLKTGTNAPLTSSMGRLFDAVSALLGISQVISYEGQAAIELEALADPSEERIYAYEITQDNILDPSLMIKSILEDQKNGLPIPIISGRFHNSIADMVLTMSTHLRDEYQLNRVALSGGVWQNMTLTNKTVKKLRSAEFQILLHQQIPPNDGGLALGQAAIGQKYLQVQREA
ncbi:MAG: carbamoyltransferase HypF [Anaerolineales bacterium]|nr:carbamoyltransferase HypF [Anaerolineales bacterium]